MMMTKKRQAGYVEVQAVALSAGSLQEIGARTHGDQHDYRVDRIGQLGRPSR